MSVAPAISSWFAHVGTSIHYRKPVELRDETGDLVVSASPPSAKSPTVLWSIQSDDHRLRATKAVTVHLRREGLYWFAENESLRVFAHGSTQAEALSEFQEHVAYFHQYFQRLTADEVVGEGARLKRLFADSFEPT